MKITKYNKGITLIALVITIIVMLILVAVTINMTINGGLFGYAGNAAGQTKTALEKEQQLGKIEEGLTTDELITLLTTNKEEDLAKLRLYFTGSAEPNGPGVLYSEIEGEERDSFKNNEVITDASTSIMGLAGGIIKYHNNYYRVTGEEVEIGEDEYDWKFTAVEPLSDAETLTFKVTSDGRYMKTIDGAEYYEYNNKIYKVTENSAVEATAEEIVEAKKVTITYGTGENIQTIVFTPTEGEKWIEWANETVEDIDLNSINTGLTLKGLIQEKHTTSMKIISYVKDSTTYSFEKIDDTGMLMTISAMPLKTTDEILTGGIYRILSFVR